MRWWFSLMAGLSELGGTVDLMVERSGHDDSPVWLKSNKRCGVSIVAPL